MAGDVENLHVADNELYFIVVNPDNSFPVSHLCQSDDTTAGTFQIDFFPAVVSELSTEVSGQILLTDGNLMFLGLNDEATGTEVGDMKLQAIQQFKILYPPFPRSLFSKPVFIKNFLIQYPGTKEYGATRIE
ncbi:MAG: hypothetical protein ABIO46_16255 [Chitinophagales bacterium]